MRISIREIKQSYAELKGIARQHLDAGDIDQALQDIRHCVVLAQQFNWIYADDELEQMEREIGERLISQCEEKYDVDNNRVVFYDDYCVTFILAIQYLEALIKAGKEVLFIYTRRVEKDPNKDFFAYVKQLKGLQILHITEPTDSETIQRVFQATVDFHPSHVLLHLEAHSMFVPVMCRLPKPITRYLINLQDQTFWLGANAIDYSIEFRPFGASVSMERRGLKREQLLMLPFYPIHDKNSFAGFPEQTKGHVTIFSGGDLYKTLDKNRAYWRLIKRILDAHPDLRFLFATKINPFGTQFIDSFIAENHYEDRFIYVGFRKDIYEVLKHCDIYMGTCPTSGSLMSQLAAMNATPILQYYYPGTPDDETEQALCINENFSISFQDEEAFMQEADKLIADAEYRKAQGERIQKSMIQPEQFGKALIALLDTHNSPFPVTTVNVDYQLLDERWYEQERLGFTNTMSYVYSLLGDKRCAAHVPTLYLKKQLLTLKNLLHL